MENSVQFKQLFTEFQTSHHLSDGLTELATYIEIRNSAYLNVQQISERLDQGEDCTDLILRKLLPYVDTANNRWLGAWTHVAAAVPGDIRRWYGAAGRTGQDDWPIVADAIWRFVTHALSKPEELAAACAEFSKIPLTKGFQMGMMTPILNALDPDHFHIVNNRTRAVLHYFTGINYSSALADYPTVNQAVKDFLIESKLATQIGETGIRPGDLFERFCYWLTAVRQFSLRPSRYWLIAAGEDSWQWEEWKDGGFVAVGWDELGDLSAVKKREFVARRDSLMAQYREWTKRDTDAVWRFSRQLQEGDQVAVYAEGDRLLGFGTVGGIYYYVAELPQSHRVPVQWEETKVRSIASGANHTVLNHTVLDSRRPLQELSAEAFVALQQAPISDETAIAPVDESYGPTFVDYFAPILELLRAEPEGKSTAEMVAALCAKDGDNPAPNERTVHRARHYLSTAGLIESPRRGHWQVTAYGGAIALDQAEMARIYQEVEYRRRVDESLLHESSIIRQLAESSAEYTVGEPPQPPLDQYDGPDAERTNQSAERPKESADGAEYAVANESSTPYSLAECADDTGFAEARLKRWVHTLKRKRQVIIYGPSGTGKTFLTHCLARHLVGGTDGFWELVQFHPAYAYEDFVQGIRPNHAVTPNNGHATAFVMKAGRFLDFCQRAEAVNGPAILIIDEINRANLARVFGELMYLLEYRNAEAILAGNGKRFQIPQNVYLIGTMNTADRSIALLDHALRRRFSFIELAPDYEIIRHFHRHHKTGVDVEPLIGLLVQINHAIGNPHHALGITYFLTPTLASDLRDIWEMEVEPTLAERFFDAPEELERFRWDVVCHHLANRQSR